MPRRMGLSHPSIAPYGLFQAADGGQLLISVQSDREWTRLCTQVVGLPNRVGPTRDLRPTSCAFGTEPKLTRRSGAPSCP